MQPSTCRRAAASRRTRSQSAPARRRSSSGASEEINYRRFFDVNQLAAVRMEDPEVFGEVHQFVFELIQRGGPTGLRVDHVDGLFAPADYLRRLQASIGSD